jgi:hypothetical protein
MPDIHGPWSCSPKTTVALWHRMRLLSNFACRRCGYAGRGNGRLLAAVAGVATGSILGRPPAAEPQRHAVGSDPSGVGRVSPPGSEWKLHRDWFGKSAMADLLGADFGLAEAHKLYACHDLLLEHKDALFSHLMARWRDLFNAKFDVLLCDLTSTFFEINASDLAEGDKRRHGYSRDKRPDCPQVVIALVVTPDGLPLAYEVLPGNTARRCGCSSPGSNSNTAVHGASG